MLLRPPRLHPSGAPPPEDTIISRQAGAIVLCADGYVVKYGDRVKLNEFEAMKLVSEQTNVPVPTPMEYSDSYPGPLGVISMAFVQGQPLKYLWKEMPSHTRNSVLTQLKGYVAESRKIKQPASCNNMLVCGIIGGPVSCEVPVPGRKFTGPFPDDHTFRKTIGEAYYSNAGRRRTPEEVTHSLPSSSSSVLSHCDLSPRNILVDGGKITGIIDWEFARWYPDYWEYAITRDNEWDVPVSSFLEPYPKGLDAVNFVRHVLLGF